MRLWQAKSAAGSALVIFELHWQPMSILAASLRVMFRTKKMERHIWLIADDPAVVSGTDIKQISSPHFIVAPVLHPAGGATGHNQADMFHVA
jgi:hypothetical protein